ncbi:MAG: hypothetical protein DMG64_17615 [Acidobacteria bacterium]|nr:MAG: hypothetical protein DMG64_17615 [Acidobacteriota bacterium]PYY21020.1 MAG: hypothetical protein DMG62_20995 [Acidobacteriota bacterium]
MWGNRGFYLAMAHRHKIVFVSPSIKEGAVPPGLGILIYTSTQHFMPKAGHFMLGFHIWRLRRVWPFGPDDAT